MRDEFTAGGQGAALVTYERSGFVDRPSTLTKAGADCVSLVATPTICEDGELVIVEDLAPNRDLATAKRKFEATVEGEAPITFDPKLHAIGVLERIVMELRSVRDGLIAHREAWGLLYQPTLRICNERLAKAEADLAEARRLF